MFGQLKERLAGWRHTLGVLERELLVFPLAVVLLATAAFWFGGKCAPWQTMGGGWVLPSLRRRLTVAPFGKSAFVGWRSFFFTSRLCGCSPAVWRRTDWTTGFTVIRRFAC